MGARQRNWARVERIRMFAILGNHCRICARSEDLSFDCIQPTNDGHGALDLARRISYYRREMRRGNLQLLCLWCNSMKSGMKPDEWRIAVQWVHETDTLQRLEDAPGRGTGLSAVEKRECLREVVSRLRANRHGKGAIL